mgnify:CR=1 FL=1
MMKLRINPIVAEDLKKIKEYIAEDNEEMAVKTIQENMPDLRVYSNFRIWELILLRGSASGRIISM